MVREFSSGVIPKINILSVGMTETTAIVAFPRGDQKIGTLGSAGQMVPGVTVRVVKEDGSLAKIGEEGELYIKSPSLALGYFNNEEACVIFVVPDSHLFAKLAV